jgi:lysylphosphatidylglycerol synthetase-like protein (DUF2156 family)
MCGRVAPTRVVIAVVAVLAVAVLAVVLVVTGVACSSSTTSKWSANRTTMHLGAVLYLQLGVNTVDAGNLQLYSSCQYGDGASPAEFHPPG